ncbi:MAG: hypothetical protein KIT87_11505 [Anaerolineae bacterium]|nr:hypothetical protein [Anaerolineae bacterium]
MVLRISRGHFAADRAETVRRMLAESEAILSPALRPLPGFHGYYTGLDDRDHWMIAVSLWDTPDHASQLGRLPEMMRLREQFQAADIAFDPITTYEILWSC